MPGIEDIPYMLERIDALEYRTIDVVRNNDPTDVPPPVVTIPPVVASTTDKTIVIQVIDGTVDTAVADGKAYLTIPPILDGYRLSDVHSQVVTAGTGAGTFTTVQIANVTKGTDMLSTKITIDATETASNSASTQPVVSTAYCIVNKYDLIRIDVDAVHTVAAKGLILYLIFAA